MAISNEGAFTKILQYYRPRLLASSDDVELSFVDSKGIKSTKKMFARCLIASVFIDLKEQDPNKRYIEIVPLRVRKSEILVQPVNQSFYEQELKLLLNVENPLLVEVKASPTISFVLSIFRAIGLRRLPETEAIYNNIQYAFVALGTALTYRNEDLIPIAKHKVKQRLNFE